MNRNDDLLNQALKTEQAGCRKDDTQCCGKCEKSMSREQFEAWYLDSWKRNCAWASEKTIDDVSAERQGDGYPGGYMQGCWEGYQAAASSMQSERDQLAAECAAIKLMNDCLSEELRKYESDGAFEGPLMHLLWWKAETPATDRFLAEQRASAIPDEASDRDLFEEWLMENICISKSTLESLRTDGGYRNSTLSGKDYNGMWSQWKAIRATQLRNEVKL